MNSRLGVRQPERSAAGSWSPWRGWWPHSINETHERKAERLLRRWRLTASVGGSLRIEAAGPTLSPLQLKELVQRLREASCSADLKEIVFDLSRVESIEPQWSIVLAMFILLDRCSACQCRLEGLHGQPALAVELYRRNRDVRSLLRAPCGGASMTGAVQSSSDSSVFFPDSSSCAKDRVHSRQ